MAKRKMPKLVNDSRPVENVKTTEEKVEVETKETNNDTVTVVSKNQLRFRAGDSTAADVICLLDPGTSLEVITKGSEWTKVKYNEKIGYVMSQFVK